MTSTAWMAQQLERVADGRRAMPLQQPRYNPRPAGVILAGSASDVVLVALRSRDGVWLTHAQILNLTSRSTKSVCWALIFLQSQGLVESTSDDSRNARYRRYRAVKEARS